MDGRGWLKGLWFCLGLCALAALAPTSAQAACDPGPGQASFYVDSNYRGACVVRGVADYPNAQAIGLPNDSISSLRVGPNTQVVICKDNNFAGDCLNITGDVPLLGGPRVGNDQVSSLKVQARGFAPCLPGPGQASFFTDANFIGGCVVRGFGDYTDAGAIGLPNDSISSIRIGPGSQAVICKDNGFTGDCLLVTGDVPLLGGPRVGNDQISSLRVQPAGLAACVPGNGQAAFFQHDGFIGPCVVKGVGDYPNAGALGLANDTLSSVKLGGGVQVIACVDNDFRKDCIKLTGDAPTMRGTRIGNDVVSSAQVQPIGHQSCVPNTHQVALFLHAGYIGPCVVLGVGAYASAGAMGIDDKQVSSILVAQGGHACVYTSAQFASAAADITSDTPQLNAALNDKISSIRVQAPGTLCYSGALAPVVAETIEPDPGNPTSPGRLHVKATGFQNHEIVTLTVSSTVGGRAAGGDVVTLQADVLGAVDYFDNGANGVCNPTRITTFTATAKGPASGTSSPKTISCGNGSA